MNDVGENGILAIQRQSSILTDNGMLLLMSNKMQHLLEMACVNGSPRFEQCIDTLDELERQWKKQDNLLANRNIHQ